jgi:hypothetical protein
MIMHERPLIAYKHCAVCDNVVANVVINNDGNIIWAWDFRHVYGQFMDVACPVSKMYRV